MTTPKANAPRPKSKPTREKEAPARAFLTSGGRKVEEHLVDGPDEGAEQDQP